MWTQAQKIKGAGGKVVATSGKGDAGKGSGSGGGIARKCVRWQKWLGGVSCIGWEIYVGQ